MAPLWLRLVVTQPALLAEHAQGYVELAGEELAAWLAHWRQRLWLAALATVSAGAAAVLAGVAVMLWAVSPASPALPAWAPWVLWAVPLAPLALALWCAARLRAPARLHPWQAVHEQLALDAAAWQPPPASA